MKWNGLNRSPIRKVSPEQKVELALRRKLKKELLEEQEYPHCMTCGGQGFPLGLSLSHIIPVGRGKARGGVTSRENCLIECIPCHQKYEKRPELRK